MNQKSKRQNKIVAGLMLSTIFFITGCVFHNDVSVNVENSSETQKDVDKYLESKPVDNLQTEKETDTEIMTETEKLETEISFVMVGDILMHTPVEESARQEDGTYSYDAIFANTVTAIQEADIALVNQEVIIAGETYGISGYPAFNAPYELGHDLIEAGFDVICHATNHALDKGKKGLLSCLEFWNQNYPNIPVLGIHGSQNEQNEIYVYEQDGIKIAILNFTYGTNGIALPSDMPYAVDLLDEDKVVAALEKAEEIADFTIVCPHWGTEYELGISNSQKKWTEIFLKNGVDVVIGTHPHVIEPIEVIVEEESGHSMLVYYSLGNFCNWTSSSGAGIANRMVGGMAQFTVGVEENGEVFLSSYGIEPLVCHLEQGINGVTVYFLDDYTQELSEKNEIRKQDENFSYEYCITLCDSVWGDLWREN